MHAQLLVAFHRQRTIDNSVMTVYLAIFSPRALLINTFEQDTQSLFPTSKDNINTLACRCLCIFKRLAWQCSDIASIPSCLHTFCCSGKLKTSCCYSTQPLSINVSHQMAGKAEKKLLPDTIDSVSTISLSIPALINSQGEK